MDTAHRHWIEVERDAADECRPNLNGPRVGRETEKIKIKKELGAGIILRSWKYFLARHPATAIVLWERLISEKTFYSFSSPVDCFPSLFLLTFTFS